MSQNITIVSTCSKIKKICSIVRNLWNKMSGDHKTLIKGSPSQYVKLNVGGTLFYTTIGTLTKSDNMLRTMFSGRMEVLTDSEGIYYFLYKDV